MQYSTVELYYLFVHRNLPIGLFMLRHWINITEKHSTFQQSIPEGQLGMSDVTPPSGISGLSLDSPFLSPHLFYCLILLLFVSCHSSGNGAFSRIFPRKFSIFFKS